MPPLRERREDIPFFINNFIKNYKKDNQIYHSLSKEAYDLLINYDYPGNIRQLENIIERLIITTQGELIEACQIEEIIGLPKRMCIDSEKIIPIKEAVKEFERKILIASFKKYKTTRKVAEVLEIDQSTVVKKVKRLEIKV